MIEVRINDGLREMMVGRKIIRKQSEKLTSATTGLVCNVRQFKTIRPHTTATEIQA